ncbi:MAG: hypothetical protein E7638_07260 [Ruminococcaceae bacterium]|nr:hypothetical protein [Oscillospiraceae bacterium]
MNQNNLKRIFFVLGAAAVVIAVFIGTTFFMASYSVFDADIGHFAAGSGMFYAFAAGCVGAVVFASAAAFLAKKKAAGDREPYYGTFRKIVSLCSAIAALVLFVSELRSELVTEGYTLPALGALITMPGLVLFFALGAIPSLRGGKVHIVSGIAACLSVNLMMFKSYFDFTLPLNSPIRNALALMEAAFLLFLLSEMRTLLQRNTPAFRCIASFSAVMLTGGIALGMLLVLFFVPDNGLWGVSALRCVLCLTAAANALFGCVDGK